MLGRHGYLRAQSWIQELSPALLNFNIQDSAFDLGLKKGQNWKMSQAPRWPQALFKEEECRESKRNESTNRE